MSDQYFIVTQDDDDDGNYRATYLSGWTESRPSRDISVGPCWPTQEAAKHYAMVLSKSIPYSKKRLTQLADPEEEPVLGTAVAQVIRENYEALMLFLSKDAEDDDYALACEHLTGLSRLLTHVAAAEAGIEPCYEERVLLQQWTETEVDED